MSKMPKNPDIQVNTNKEKAEELTFKEFLAVSKWILNLQLSIDRPAVIQYTILRVINRLTPIGYAYITAKILDILISLVQEKGVLSAIYPYLGVLLVYMLIQNLFSALETATQNRFRQKVYFNNRRFLYEKLISLGIQSLENPEVTNNTNRVSSSLSNAFNFFRGGLNVITTFISFSVSLGIVAFHFPIIIPIVVGAALPAIINDKKYNTELWHFDIENTEGRRLAWANAGDLGSPNTLKELLIVRGQNFLSKKYVGFFEWYSAEVTKILNRWVWTSTSFDTLSTFAYIFSFILILSSLLVGNITVGSVYFLLNLVDRLSRDVAAFSNYLNNMYENSLKYKDAYNLFKMEPAFPDGRISIEKINRGPKVDIENLSFQYPSSEERVLENLDLSISSGEKIAIVGHNGAGKTTLAKLIAKMYLPTEGDIKINDLSTKDIKSSSLYQNLAVLFQDYNTHDHLSVKENVYIGKPGEDLNEDAVIEALKKADAWDFVSKYPNGLDQILSERFRGGIRPSTGQWQKIAIARFFYRDAPLVIFDEPTAAIDAVSEYNIFNKIYEFFKDKTVIIISHRFSTVRNADRIVVIDEGKVVEQGSHEELMEKNGYYAESFRLQAEGYADEPVSTIV